jgi:hypothetical protein
MPSFPGGAIISSCVFLFAGRIMNEGRELRDEQDLVVQSKSDPMPIVVNLDVMLAERWPSPRGSLQYIREAVPSLGVPARGPCNSVA